jgi:hypothetical protein
MNVDVIGMWFPRLATIYIFVVMALVFVGVPVLIVVYLLGLNKRLKNMSRDWKLSKFELGKLAEEVQQLRQQLKDTDPRATSVNPEPENEKERDKK